MDKILEIIKKYKELNQQLSEPNIAKDIQLFKNTSIELNSLKDVYPLAEKFRDLTLEKMDAELLLKDSNLNDEEIAYYKEVIHDNKEQLENLEKQIDQLTMRIDPNDKRNIIIELRAGTGGEEAALFAGELYRMYLRYAESKNWEIEQLSISEAGQGGIKEVITSIKGSNVYGNLKFESGVHRVQRVPATESAGRIHTSSASLVILPEVEDFEININPEEIKLDLFRAGGPGGQGVNTTDSAVRLTHIPSGIVVSCQDERSQLKNKNRAMSILKSRLYDLELSKKEADLSSQRKDAIKTGDRSEKIRTYNFPQNRVTDHRIKISWFNLSEIMAGNIEDLLDTVKEKLATNV